VEVEVGADEELAVGSREGYMEPYDIVERASTCDEEGGGGGGGGGGGVKCPYVLALEVVG
jgi:hypothetical protein